MLKTWTEQYMGYLEGCLWGDVQGLNSGSGERKAIREPESPKVVRERGMTWWRETIIGTTASCVLIVSHGSWIRNLVQGLLDHGDLRAEHGVTVGRCYNTAVSVVEIPRDRGRGKLLQYANTMHLRQVNVIQDNADEGEGPEPRK
jgi:broad specificity phosphatase PhoE